MNLRFGASASPSFFRPKPPVSVASIPVPALEAAVLTETVEFRSALENAVGTAEGAFARFDVAVDLYEGGEWRQAFDALSALADDGDPASAKLALLMLRHGAALYGEHFVAQPRQIARWARCVLAASAALRAQAFRAPVGPLRRDRSRPSRNSSTSCTA